jgi:hypothetical protein
VTVKVGAKQKPEETEEPDEHVFTCPTCSRPLARGALRCPGCGARLVLGVAIKQAGPILVLGLVVGGLVGGLIVTAGLGVVLRPSSAEAAALPSGEPSQPGASNGPSASAQAIALPMGGAAALTGTAAMNSRMATDTRALKATLRRHRPAAPDIARDLRSLAADAAAGIDLLGRQAKWKDAEPVMAQLEAFYRTVGDRASSALRNSLTDAHAYRKAGRAMLKTMHRLDTVDASLRKLAASVGLGLPPTGGTAVAGTGVVDSR